MRTIRAAEKNTPETDWFIHVNNAFCSKSRPPLVSGPMEADQSNFEEHGTDANLNSRRPPR
ncbi:hypothetical protein TSAR_012009, partial [Trichomalopsis sarcophagae]